MISVTELIDLYPEKELTDWKLRVGVKKATEISEEALRIGKEIDTLVQQQVRMNTYTVPPESVIEQTWANWLYFLEKQPVNFLTSIVSIQTELVTGELIGHPDFLRRLPDGRWGIDDLKCASQIRPSHFVQLGGYAWLMGHQAETNAPRNLLPPHFPPDWLGIIRLNKDRPGYDYLQLTASADIQTAIETFLCYKKMFELRETVTRWIIDYRETESLHESRL